MRRLALLLLCLGAIPSLRAAPEYRAGVSRISITPRESIWLSGYAARTHPSTGIRQEIWAKALAIESRKGGRVVLVSTDLIGLPRSISDQVAARALAQYGLDRSDLVLNSSHTHTGPMVRGNLVNIGALDAAQSQIVAAYGQDLVEKLVAIIGAALGALRPAKIEFGQGECGFAANRRPFAARPVDHSVPVLRVSAEDGKVLAILFGYACHNTTLTGEFYEISGDYAGYSQTAVEDAFPGSTAMFFMLCGGDQNPDPRSTLELAQQHGGTLAREVVRVARQPLAPVSGPIRTAFRIVDLPLAVHTRPQFEEERKDANPFKARRAEMMLTAYDERRVPRSVPYPVQAVGFQRGFLLVALGGEVVVDYALWLKREFSNQPLMAAGYSNDVMCYIPSARVLREGGYEAVDSMIYYALPGPFNDEVEARVQDAVRGVIERVRHGKVRRD